MTEQLSVEDMVRRILAEAVRCGVVTCDRDPLAMSSGEVVGPANMLAGILAEIENARRERTEDRR